jgi:hypothetical protein
MHNPQASSFIGHPRDLAYIAFTEAWERFPVTTSPRVSRQRSSLDV